jgi:hypothetical protein
VSRATILACPEVTPEDRRLARLTEFLGIECDVQAVPDGPAGLAAPDGDCHCVMASAATLGALLARRGGDAELVPRLLARTRYLLVYGFRPTAPDAATLHHLSDGRLDAVRPLPSGQSRYTVSADWRSLTREFSGLTFGPARPEIDAVFSVTHRSPGLRPLISIAGSPSFVSLTRGECTMFLLACRDIADLGVTVGELRAVEWFSRVIPATMFIRQAYGPRSWHNPWPTAAFIIDDPLLKERYGFLNYRQLLRATADQPFAATIAFIPFNFRRNQPSVVELFRARPDRLSLCIHGCNHTGGEFATTDLSALNAMSRLAADRMRAHEQATALAHGRIMVFPQGRFSSASLRALRGNGYVAAVNTSPLPDGAGPDDHLTLREWLEVAVTRYHGFPLFVRRYPGDPVDFAFDLFFGKPLLVVEHHTAFRRGYREIAEFVAALNALHPGLRWGSLHDTLAHASLRRRLSSGATAVRLWSNRSIIRPDVEGPTSYALVKDEAIDASIEHVTVDGRPVGHRLDHGRLWTSIEIEPPAAPVVEVAYANDLPPGESTLGLRAALAIHARRRLSELRDELMSRRQHWRVFAGFGTAPARRV